MPLLVTKNVVPAPCACAGCAAMQASETAAVAKHPRDIILKTGIVFLPVCFLIRRLVDRRATTKHQPTGSGNIPRSGVMIHDHTKKRRGMNRGARFKSSCRRSGLLDCREFPVGAARPHEGPHFGG